MRRFFVNDVSSYANVFLTQMHAFFDYKTKQSANRFGPLGKIKKDLLDLKSTYSAKQGVPDYLDFLHNYLEEVLLIKPNQMNEIIAGNHFFLKPNDPRSLTTPLNPKAATQQNINSVYEDIVNALKYTKAREILFDIYNDMGIKTCVYCNAQYVTNFVYKDADGKTQKRGNFQVDHFHDKSSWPCFASSFYNLFPTCGPCNNVKNNSKNVKFNLYTEDKDNIDPFIFSLDSQKVCLQNLKHNYSDIEIVFSCANIRNQNKNVKDPRKIKEINNSYKEDYDGHVNILHIDCLYNQNFRSTIGKLLARINDNDDDYQNQLRNAYSYLKNNGLLNINEFIYGFIQEAERIHEEPLTKLKQDILKQFNGKIK